MRKDADWFAFEDLAGREVTLTIKDVLFFEEYKFETGSKEQNMWALAFEGAHRKLRINAAIRKALGAMLGYTWEDWRGKKITLYGDPTVKFGKKQVGGVRVKAAK